MDFGIARDGASRRITHFGNTPTKGTPDYMAPEQVQGKRADNRTDIYNLGALLYENARWCHSVPKFQVGMHICVRALVLQGL